MKGEKKYKCRDGDIAQLQVKTGERAEEKNKRGRENNVTFGSTSSLLLLGSLLSGLGDCDRSLSEIC